MISDKSVYCLDANVLIQAWQKYYSPVLCPDYWDLLNVLGKQGTVFLPESVAGEIHKTEDDLTAWLKKSEIPIHKIDGEVTQLIADIFHANPLHRNLVDNTKGRSLADPWVIAHAMQSKACVVTKEDKVINPNTTRIKIPNVCENMGVRWINDFQMLAELQVSFSYRIKV